MIFKQIERRSKFDNYIEIINAPPSYANLEQTIYLNAEVQLGVMFELPPGTKAVQYDVDTFLNGYFFVYVFDPAFSKPEAKPFVAWIEREFERQNEKRGV